MRQTKFRNRLVTLVGVFMLLSGALLYALPAHAGQGSNGLTENGVTANGIYGNGLTTKGKYLPFKSLSQKPLGETHPDCMDAKPTRNHLKALANSR
jgi:hypothetical protein